MRNFKINLVILLALTLTLTACGGGTGKAETEGNGSAGTAKGSVVTTSETNGSDMELSGGEWSPEDAAQTGERAESNGSDSGQAASTQATTSTSGGPSLNVPGWTTDKVKFRASPAFSDNVVSVLPLGTEVLLIQELGEWNEVSYDNAIGYVASEYMTKEAPTDGEDGQGAEGSETNGSQTATSKPARTGGGRLVCIDPGHQRRGDSTKEPNGPGSSTTKARVTGGTSGRTTGVPEYQLNLDIALKLRDELVARGYQVVMTRETHDVNISNKERAEFATNAGADITVRIHANGSENTGVSGALTMAPSANNPYVSNLASDSQKLSKEIINAYCASTGMNNQGVVKTDTMTGINWCTMPVTIVEMGYMTNATDDTNMQDANYQSKMVTGIANGIDNYFK